MVLFFIIVLVGGAFAIAVYASETRSSLPQRPGMKRTV
jgi:hypothetical protein